MDEPVAYADRTTPSLRLISADDPETDEGYEGIVG